MSDGDEDDYVLRMYDEDIDYEERMKVKKKAKVSVDKAVGYVTPVGRLLRVCILQPAKQDQYNDGTKFRVDIAWKKDKFKADPLGIQLLKATLAVGKAFFKDQSLTLQDFKHPFLDGDESDWKPVEGCFFCRPSSQFQIAVCGPGGFEDKWSESQIRSIKAGDFARLVVNPFPYPTNGGGISFGVNALQFVQVGKALEGGNLKALKVFEEVEVDIDSLGFETAADGEDDDEENEQPVTRKTSGNKAGKRVSQQDEDDDETQLDISDDDGDDSDSDGEESDSDDAEEVLAPVKAKAMVKKTKMNSKEHPSDILI